MQRRQFTPAFPMLLLARTACLALLGRSIDAFALGEIEAASGVRAAPDYVTRKALDGLYFMVGQEEKKIRADPVGTGSALLNAVFGGR